MTVLNRLLNLVLLTLFTVALSSSALAAPAVPYTPANLRATEITSTQVNLKWNASTVRRATVRSYLIYRNGTLVGTVASSRTTFNNTGLTPGKNYQYQVAAKSSTGVISELSPKLAVKTKIVEVIPPPPTIPTTTTTMPPTTTTTTTLPPTQPPPPAEPPPVPPTTGTGCDCGSTTSACSGNSISYTRGSGTLPSSTIEFKFQCDGGACACGKFANKYDYWVAPKKANGVVKIISMTPATIGAADATLRNGWVANPSAIVTSSFMDGRLGDMTNTGKPLNPTASAPFVVDTALVPVTTVVKSHSILETGATCGTEDPATLISRHCFWQAGVLTVLNQIPVNAGSTILRPPLTGTEKPLNSIAQIDFAALPNLPLPVRKDGIVVTGPAWADALDLMGPPKVEWGTSGNYQYWQYMPPMYNFSKHISGYGPRSTQALLDSMQLLAINGAGHEQEKNLLTIRSVQWGLDYYYMWKARNYGPMYMPNGGHAVGRYLPTIIAAALTTGALGNQMKTDMLRVNNANSDKCAFDISGEINYWPDTKRVLFGYVNTPGCSTYSDYTKQTNSNYVDPSHIGDNGRLSINADNDTVAVNSCAGAYQPITLGPTHATANLIRAIPAAKAIAYQHMIPYVTRMFDFGAACRADRVPAAAYDSAFGKCVGGVNIGEQCVGNKDCPTSTCAGNNNQYTSWLARNMWAKYKDCYDKKTCPGMTGL